MPRRPREDEPGAWHHVMNRAIARRPLYEDRRDVRCFLACLAWIVRAGLLEVHAWCVMSTHFHLLVRSPRGGLSDALRTIQREYSRAFNRRHRRDGALARGRFRSKRVRSLEYRRTLVRYIDHNPVAARIAAVPWMYPWGSARQYVTTDGPPWLSRGWVEDEVAVRTGSRDCCVRDYAATFAAGSAEGLARMVEERWRARSSGPDPLDDLIGSAPERVRNWMLRKARLADGMDVGEAVCDATTLLAVCADLRLSNEPDCEAQRRVLSPRHAAIVGLLRTLARSRWADVMQATGLPETTCRRALALHQSLLCEDPAYSGRVACVAADALRRCHGR